MIKNLKNRFVPTKTIGAKAEENAKKYLQSQGLTFVTQNYHCRLGEIDLIFKDKDNSLVFIEVKYRSDSQFGHAEEMVTPQKQRKIIQAARTYLHDKKLSESVAVRFDVIAIEPQANNTGDQLSIQWIKDAFQAV